jgi:putative nucleotidyltransferase with HDIG domain
VSTGSERPPAAGPVGRDGGPDPTVILKALTGLRQLTSLYPAGHTVVEQALRGLEDALRPLLLDSPSVRIDVIGLDAHLNEVPYRHESRVHASVIQEFLALGVNSIHFSSGVTREELAQVSRFLTRHKDSEQAQATASLLERLGVTHVSLGRLVTLDTRWQAREWPDRPVGPLDPDYAESLELAENTFAALGMGRAPEAAPLRDLLRLLMFKVAGSTAALGQILAVKQYENHTYCHSVNVAIISVLLGRRLGLDEAKLSWLGEGALLHDVGKLQVPVEILKKPAQLDRRERTIVERHPSTGAAMLVNVPDLAPLTPTLALEHHRHFVGSGYPDLGEGAIPHLLSQIVAIADIYEAMTGARSYRDPALPEQACLVLARLGGTQLNPAFVRAFVGIVTFFPIGTLVRTTLDEVGIVVRTSAHDPLHPVIALAEDLQTLDSRTPEIDLSERDNHGTYRRHVAHSLVPAAPALASP